MSRYEVVLRDRTAEEIDGADAYAQEGSMTTFFALGEGREVVDSWARRVASVRTADVLFIRLVEQTAPGLRAVG